MKEAVNRLILEEEPGNTECDKDENIIAHFAVRNDAAWQNRGNSSTIGILFIISVRADKVLE